MVMPELNRTWESVRLGDYANVLRGGSPRPIQDYLTNSSQGINWIKIGDTRKGEKYITSTVEKIIPEGISKSREVFVGDLLLSNSMSFGRPYILEINGCIHDGWLVIQDYHNSFDTQYLYYSLLTDSVKQQFNNLAAGSGVHNLNKDIVSNVTLNKPKKDEQIAVAAVLSDIDSLIDNLEKLIAKKKNIKQGAMQELLTGKHRLPGFSETWKTEPLSHMCIDITDGSHESPTESISNYFMPSVKDMTSRGFDYSNCKQISKTDYEKLVRNGCQPHEGDVLIAKDGSILKYVFVYTETNHTVILSSIAIIRPNTNKIYGQYLVQYFRQSSFVEDVIRNNKTGTGVPRIVLENFKKIPIAYPPKTDEQIAIASVLSDMDSEIDELEKKLVKYRNIKKGMMSELLTGRIRLTDKEGA